MEDMGCAMMAREELPAEEQKQGQELVNAGKTLGDWANEMQFREYSNLRKNK